MKCHDAQSLFVDYALGLLEKQQRSKIETHLATGCAACRNELSEMHETLAALTDAEPLLSPRAELKSLILDRIEADRVTVGETTSVAPAAGEQRFRGWQLLAAGLAVIAVGAQVYHLVGMENAADTQRVAVEAWQRQIEGTKRQFGLVGTSLVSLPLSQASQGSVSHVLVDQVTHQLHVWTKPFAKDDPTAPNRAWVLDSQDRVLGHAALEKKGDRLGAVIDTIKVDMPTRCRVLLTQEPVPPGSQPGDEVIDDAGFEIR